MLASEWVLVASILVLSIVLSLAAAPQNFRDGERVQQTRSLRR